MNLPKGIIYVLIAGVAGLLAAYTTHRYVIAKTRVPKAVSGQVVVATTDISPGTPLNSQLVKTMRWPKEVIPAQTASTLQEVDGRVVKTELHKGEPILFSRLAPEGTAAGLSGLLDESKRAFTVRVDDVSGVAGFIHPGDRVDVLADIRIPKGDENFSKTILQNIRVLTTGQIWERKGDSKPVVVNTVTLELAPEQAEVLNLASNEGKIRLALRSRHNQATVETRGVATSHLVTSGTRQASESTPLAQKNGREVDVIKGLERSKASL